MRELYVFGMVLFGVLSGTGIGFLFHLIRITDFYIANDAKIPFRVTRDKSIVAFVELLCISVFFFCVIGYISKLGFGYL